ncbi:MAG: signal peptidase I [Anaplasmataceae bacterium]|nr:signal peptidase I [Anaplasmataceae bacterium]
MRRLLISIFEVVEVAVVALLAVFLIRTYLVQPFLVSGNSMVPNFAHGDYLLVDELTYRFRDPLRGEVAVFHYPQNETQFFIKRVVALPGERVVIKDNTITIFNEEYPEGVVLEEDYLPSDLLTAGTTDTTLSEDEYFVLGDNRSFSFDSRSWGLLSRNEIVGVVRLRLWPLRSIEAFAAPQYEGVL